MLLEVEQLATLTDEALLAYGFTDDERRICVAEIVDAECRGRSSHGAAIVPEVVEWKTEGSGPIVVERETPVSALIRGNHSIGPLVAEQAMDLAMTKAANHGVGIVGVNNKYPFMLAGYNPRRAAQQGFIGINWSVAASKVALYGGADPLIGTNPLGVGIPQADGEPVVLDMAVTEIAAAEIRRLKKVGRPLPDGVALNADGIQTTSPADALGGAMLPFGGYKGSGLGVIIELLGGPFVGAKAGHNVPGERGMVFVALQPDLFVDRGAFFEAISTFVAEVGGSRVREGFDAVRLPGQRGDELAANARKTGKVEVDDSAIADLRRLTSPARPS